MEQLLPDPEEVSIAPRRVVPIEESRRIDQILNGSDAGILGWISKWWFESQKHVCVLFIDSTNGAYDSYHFENPFKRLKTKLDSQVSSASFNEDLKVAEFHDMFTLIFLALSVQTDFVHFVLSFFII